MKLKIFFLFIFSQIFISSFAQESLIEGFIVNMKGDTLNGYLYEFSSKRPPSTIIFKRFDFDYPHKYRLSEIKALGFINGNQYEWKNLNNKKVFAQIIKVDKINLIYYKDDYYFETDDNNYIKISKLPVKINENTYNTRESFLTAYFVKHASFDDTAKQTNTIRKIENVFSSSDIQTNNKLVKFQLFSLKRYFGITLSSGICHNKLIQPTNTNPLPALDNYKSSNFVGIYYTQNFYQIPKLIILAEIDLYSKQKDYSYRETKVQGNFNNLSELYFNYQFIKIPVLIGYRLPSVKNSFTVKLGLSFDYLISSSSETHYYNIFGENIINSKKENDNISFKTKNFSGIIEVDYHLQRLQLPLFIGLRYEQFIKPFATQTFKVYQDNTFKQKYSQLSFVVSYYFGKKL
jgi:hypothetical protein